MSAVDAEDLRALIEAALPGAEVRAEGDGRHFQAVVVSSAFAGKSPVARHRMVYAALGGRLDGELIHALALRTYTPEEWARLGA